MFSAMHILAITFLAVPFANRAGEDRKPMARSFDDAEYVMKAASAGMLEVELGKVAMIRSKNDNLKAFGERMVKDHGKIGDELKKAAKAAGLLLPEKMNDEHKKEFERFKDYKGENFDHDYIAYMVNCHEADLAEFTRASKEAQNPAVKDFANKTLAVVQSHLDIAKKLQQEIK